MNKAVQTIKLLALEAIASANSGHGGIALGAANTIYALFHDHLNFDIKNNDYFNRDRFILSSGHGSALLYATMCVFGFNGINVDDLKSFRKFDSKTPGHPESLITLGIEFSTGPLGQGTSSSVGFAICEQHLANLISPKVINHYTYVMMGDGDLEEGVTQEAIIIAGKLKLNKLIWLYDSNDVQLDGNVQDSTNWDVKQIFQASGWNYIFVKEPKVEEISKAIAKAKLSSDKPTLIEIKTIIGEGVDEIEGTNKAHGFTPNFEKVDQLKKKWNYSYDNFVIPNDVKEDCEILQKRCKKNIDEFNLELEKLKSNDKEKYDLLEKILNDKFYINYNELEKITTPEKYSSREFVGLVFKNIWDKNTNFLTVNPDISSSTKIACSNAKQNIQVGVREFVAAAIVNGIVAHKGSRAVFSSFLSFVDYCKASLRIAGLSSLPALGVFTHDSILVGEDGPSHQPIEQIPSLRLIPNYFVFRPCNIKEAIAAFKWYFENSKPVAIIGSRSGFKQIYNNDISIDEINKGAYVLINEKDYDLIIISTGSEIALSYDVINLLKEKKIKCRLISCVCLELFRKQTEEYKNNLLGNKNKPIVSIELSMPYMWYELADFAIGVETFGVSGKMEDIVKNLKFDPQSVCDKILNFLKKQNK